MQIQIEKTLDVELVERQLAELWQQTAGDRRLETDAPVLRARVANLLVFVPGETLLDEVQDMILELTAVHPSRVLIMLGERNATAHDIEMYVATFCQSDKRTGAKRLCCEEVTLKASGPFINELPSAALPLLVSDLSTYLWWRDELQIADKTLATLLGGIDRLVIDSSEFKDPLAGVEQTHSLFKHEHYKNVGISDLNWARLTFWRGLLADFYDVLANHKWLEEVDHVKVDFVAPEKAQDTVAPQALLISGWLASRLGWQLVGGSRNENQGFVFEFDSPARFGPTTTAENTDRSQKIKLELTRVERAGLKPGRLVEVRLSSGKSNGRVSFRVGRSEDARHLFAEAELGESVNRGRVLPVRNRSAAQLVGREMEIVCNDDIYQEAIAMAVRMIKTLLVGGKSQS